MLMKGLLFSFGFLAMLSTLLGCACIRSGSTAEREYENLEMCKCAPWSNPGRVSVSIGQRAAKTDQAHPSLFVDKKLGQDRFRNPAPQNPKVF